MTGICLVYTSHMTFDVYLTPTRLPVIWHTMSYDRYTTWYMSGIRQISSYRWHLPSIYQTFTSRINFSRFSRCKNCCLRLPFCGFLHPVWKKQDRLGKSHDIRHDISTRKDIGTPDPDIVCPNIRIHMSSRLSRYQYILISDLILGLILWTNIGYFQTSGYTRCREILVPYIGYNPISGPIMIKKCLDSDIGYDISIYGYRDICPDIWTCQECRCPGPAIIENNIKTMENNVSL
jgi:hypothetical protein